MPGLVLWRPVADIRAECGGHHHVPAHHHAARDHNSGISAHEVHRRKADEHDGRRGHGEAHFADPIDKSAGDDAHNACEYQHHAEDYRIVLDAEIVLDIDYQVWEEHLHGDRENAESREGQVKLRILTHNRGAQAVEQVFEIAVPPRREPRRILDQHERHESDDGYRDAEDVEKLAPFSLLGQPVKAAEDYQHGDERQYRQHALHAAAVVTVGDIRDVGVESRVVRGAAEEGHHAVEHDHHHRRSRRRVRRGEKPPRVLRCNVAESGGRESPEYVARADECLALADTVRQRPHEKRRHRRGGGRPADHRGNIAGVGADGVIEEHVEIHVLYRPRELPEQAN